MSETARILLVARSDDPWKGVMTRLGSRGLAFELLGPFVPPARVASEAKESASVIVVDLSPEPAWGMEVVAACRAHAPDAPVVAVAENPSVELARAIRESGVFYLAIHPVTADEIEAVIGDGLRSIERRKPSASSCRTRKRVLVVDDDEDYRASVTVLLEREGYAVHCAASASEGMAWLDRERPDLIVLDVMMEDAFAGYGLNQAVKFGDRRGVAGDVPILMVSSIAEPPERAFAGAAEAALITPDDYLVKPLDIPVFLEHVRRLLAGPVRVG